MSKSCRAHLMWSVLDRVCLALESGQVARGMRDLIALLRSHRLSVSPEEWKLTVALVREHRLMDLLQGDPFTRRCFEKPNGYPGDATLLDLIYSTENQAWAPRHLSPLSQELFRWTSNHAAPQAVRNRRRYLASLVDEVSSEVGGATILTIAAGHLREAELCQSLRTGKIQKWIATDQDANSLQMIEKTYGGWGVTTKTLPIMSLLRHRGNKPRDRYDLVYAAGLYDYLNAKTGKRLLEVMFEMVHPGGTVLITNFAEAIPDVGYMEAYMDWYLIYRSMQDMMELAADVPCDQIDDCEVFTDDTETLLYLRLTKR